MLTLITPTGGRHQAFSLCKKWMERQTYSGPVKWIIIDDCQPHTDTTFSKKDWELIVVRPTPSWQEGQNTQARNLKEGMKLVTQKDKVVFIEDDDYYSAEYLKVVDSWLDRYNLVGESKSKYFNISSGVHLDCGNTQHASLCSTAITGDAIDTFQRVCTDSHKFIDLELWRKYRGKKSLYETGMVVGIKGLPGRSGIGAGHRMKGDSDYSELEKWIGSDAKIYLGED